jgi:trehalose/maltose transport system permease protein
VLKNRIEHSLGLLAFYVLILVIALYILFPIYWAFITALKPNAEAIASPATWFPHRLTFEHFQTIFNNEILMRSMLNSFVVAGATTLLSLFVGSFAAFALGKLRFRFKKITLYIILAMTTFPAISLLSGLFSLYQYTRALDEALSWLTIPSQVLLVALYMIFALPFTIWTLTYFFKGLPDSLLQAALIDGANPLQVLYFVMIPLTTPALVSAGLITFITAWNEYLFALTFTLQEPHSRTIPVAITQYYAPGVPSGEVMAAAIIVMIPTLVLVVIFQRRISAGLTVGALKE